MRMLAADVRSVIEDLGPDVVVTLDASDGHRDHACIRDAALAAVDTSTRPPAATYLWRLRRSSMARWADRLRELGGDAYLALAQLGTPDDEITNRLDVRAVVATRWADDPHVRQPGEPVRRSSADLQDDFLTTDRLRLVRGTDIVATLAT
jgi:LmbE family N-acetylglucosaminyl deacetylase